MLNYVINSFMPSGLLTLPTGEILQQDSRTTIKGVGKFRKSITHILL
jgi:hypothetical protein